MKQQHFRFLDPKVTKIPLLTNVVIASSLLLLGISGCSSKSPTEVQLEIQGIQREDSNGLYKIVGSTNLPESSRIAVTAVRYLRSTTANTEEILDDDKNINRSILARQIVEVKQGKWQADLNLWQIAPNGNFQEVWQLNRGDKKLTPGGEVSFIATFNPDAQLPSSDRQNSQNTLQYQNLEGKSLRFTNEGEKYVQASQYRSIPLPVGKTTPPPLELEFNDGWGNRSQIQAQSSDSRPILPPVSKSQQTSFPLLNSEFLR